MMAMVKDFLFLGILCLLTSGSATIDDVTTIYNLQKLDSHKQRNPVEIHARTNALGLAPLTEFGFLEPVNNQNDLLCWNSSASQVAKCDWTRSGFNLVSLDQDIGKINTDNIPFKGDIIVQGCRDDRDDYYYDRYGRSRYRSNTPDNEFSCMIYIFPLLGIDKKVFYKIETKSRCRTCNIRGYLKLCSDEDPLTNYESASCQTLQTFDVGSSTAPVLLIETTDHEIRLWSGTGKYQHQLLTKVNNYYFDKTLKIVKTSYDGTLSPPSVTAKSQVLKSQPGQNNTLTSPKVVFAEEEDFCLRVVFHVISRMQVSGDVMFVTAVDYQNNQHLLDTFTIDRLQVGWNYWKIEKTLPKALLGKPINIVLRSLINSKVTIKRIASCNAEDDEDVSIISSDMIANEHDKEEKKFPFNGGRAYYVTQEPILIPSTNESLCFNGGKLTDTGCACPAGFTGSDCSIACGRNRYGQDCGGKCSMYGEGCKGLLLCTPGAGCHCAPGYHGEHCEDECNTGSYGANCSQSCGRCHWFTNSCDKFTGHCLQCSPGYRLPYCKEKSAHLKLAPMVVSNQYGTLTVFLNFSMDNIAGFGNPIYYQVQYKTPRGFRFNPYDNTRWKVYTTQLMLTNALMSEVQLFGFEDASVQLEGLKDASEYKIRVVLLVDDFNNYEEEDIPFTTVPTKCEIPDAYNYNINVSKSIKLDHVKDMEFTWSYITQDHWCPVVDYEFWWKESWQWTKKTISSTSFHIPNVFPSEKLIVKVRANTIGGFAPFSQVFKTSGMYDSNGYQTVRNLRTKSIERNSVEITWDPPARLDSSLFSDITYMVTYKCNRRPSCSSSCESSGALNVTKTSVSLAPLLPGAQYQVTVAADFGREAFLYFRTLESVPDEVPVESKIRPTKTNSSATVYWEPTEVCSGFLQNYQYQLYVASDIKRVLSSGKTKNTNVTFNNLQPSTEYIVRVSVMTTSGWDPTKYLEITLNTAATVPEQVQDLTVYKRSRSMVGLRWAEPRALYGALDSFTVSYSSVNTPSKSVSVVPTRCSAWPELFCHTVEGLKPVKIYNFTVKARNKEVHEDGAETSVIGQTRETSPTAPRNLTVTNVTANEIRLQWKHPDLANGVLRSFLVSVEETEQYDQDRCCQDFPIIEIPVTEEQQYYHVEVSGLHPASTYSISVSGKTVGFGASQTISASTRPPVAVVSPPQVDINDATPVQWKWQSQPRLPEANLSQVYNSLVRSRILLVLTNNTNQETNGIKDERLNALLKQEMPTNFYFAAEYNQDETVDVGSNDEGESEWGHFSNPPLKAGQLYQLAAVQISEYNKVLSIDFVLSTEFQL